MVLAHPLKVKAIADAKIKTDKIDATVLAHLLRADLVPEAWAPGEKARKLRIALRERMFYVRLRTMVKNRIVTVFDRYPEQTAQLKKLGDLFGKAGRQQLATLSVSEIDRIQINRGLDFIGDIDGRIRQSEATIRAMTKTNGNVKLLKTIPGIGEAETFLSQSGRYCRVVEPLMSQFEQPDLHLGAARKGAQGMNSRLDLAFGNFTASPNDADRNPISDHPLQDHFVDQAAY